MPEITNRESLEAWLETRPREDAVLIAARAALRVLPLLVGLTERGASERHNLLSLKRSLALANLVSKWPDLASAAKGATVPATVAAYDAAKLTQFTPTGAAIRRANEHRAVNSAADAVAYAADAASEFSGRGVTAKTRAMLAVMSARSATAVVAGTGGADFWQAVSLDALTLELERHPANFDAIPLWHGMQPPLWVNDRWQRMSTHLLDVGESWDVWTVWYDALLHGRPQDPDLELAKALIADETWKQGPVVVNAEIARLIAEHETSAGYAADRQNLAELALRSSRIRAALTDFTYDQLANLMRSVAFADDLKQLDDPEEVRRRHDRLADLAQDADELLEDLKASPANMPVVENALRRYRDEALRPIEIARHRRLWFNYGAALNRTVLDHYAMSTLGEPLAGNLRDMVQRHLDLFRDYLAVVAARTAVLDEILPRPGATLRDAVAVMDAVLQEIGNPDVGPPADEDTQGAFRMDRDQLRDMLHAAEMAHEAKQREKHEAVAWLRVKLFAVTALRLKIRALQAAGHTAWSGVSAAATASSALNGLERYFPDAHRRLIDLFVNLLPK